MLSSSIRSSVSLLGDPATLSQGGRTDSQRQNLYPYPIGPKGHRLLAIRLPHPPAAPLVYPVLWQRAQCDIPPFAVDDVDGVQCLPSDDRTDGGRHYPRSRESTDLHLPVVGISIRSGGAINPEHSTIVQDPRQLAEMPDPEGPKMSVGRSRFLA
ncbi:hypothetical protein SCP_1201780 [Sparassis crispa]|uniref:Uncharacterized protein n=1 Tax=Sparassis crispa TaxID=139825 RepID=A0A401H0N1_9APHY|nr:hypothetical protein SCP_1201780 [Sparassis crispa]GBE87952.1 hypothetical protein SCP_1201780 [Sparassis crispa]